MSAGASSVDEAEKLEAITREAGAIALSWFRQDERTQAQIFYKSGNSPVTEADLAVDIFLKSECARAFPDCAWLSEETADTKDRLTARRVVIADPIDGTKAFLSGDPRWCVSVAIVEEGRPMLACLHAPALGEFFSARLGGGAFLNGERLQVDGPAAARLGAVHGPRPMIDWLARLSGQALTMLPRIPSLAYRLAVVAKGESAMGLAGPDSHDWDIAAADLILTEAGCALLDPSGERPVYNRADPVHPALIGAEAGRAQAMVDAVMRARKAG